MESKRKERRIRYDDYPKNPLPQVRQVVLDYLPGKIIGSREGSNFFMQ